MQREQDGTSGLDAVSSKRQMTSPSPPDQGGWGASNLADIPWRRTPDRSKKVENHALAVALQFFAANYCRPHMTLTKARGGIHTSPAMAAGLTDHVWTIEEVLGMMDGTANVG